MKHNLRHLTHSSFLNLVRLKRPHLLLLLSFLVMMVLTRTMDAVSDPYGGDLVLASTSDPKSFNPIIAKETSTTEITGLMFEALTRINAETLEVEPNLAQRWEMDPSGKVWTFYLRKDVTWSDGALFKAQDVVFTFNQLIFNDQIFASSRDIFVIDGAFLQVEEIDEFTVRIVLPKPFAPFLMMIAGQPIMPKHKLEKYVNDGTFNSAWGLNSLPEDIVGTGPFVLNKYEAAQRVVLHKNSHYWKKDDQARALPYLNRIVFVILQNADVALMRFQEGMLDLVTIRGPDYPTLKPKEHEGHFTIFRMGPGFGETFLTFNQNLGNKENGLPLVPIRLRNLFRDVRFRQAVSYAIDRSSMIDILMNGLGFSQFSPLSPAAKVFYNDQVLQYSYNKDNAIKLLKELGFEDRDQNGFVEDIKGEEIVFSILTNADNTQRVQTAQMIRKDLENIGIHTQIVPVEFNALVTKLNASFDWEAVILGLSGGVEPHLARNVWHSSGQLHLWNPMQKKATTEWEEKIDIIFDKGVSEMDLEKRKSLYGEWQMIASEYLPLIYTVQPERIFAVRNRFGNLKPTLYGGAFHNIEEIYVISPDES
ncbi:MAG: ABC transporter substrate-binding protein [Chlamydiota bacterium]|nr:ABC transporter substrate-binding protein [Chlamydiota bacterium]